jgi:hypothetical protein
MNAKEASKYLKTQEAQMEVAWCAIKYRDELDGAYRYEYISFGTYNPATNKDEFGNKDDDVFFYTNGLKGFKSLLKNKGEDFVVFDCTYDVLPDYTFTFRPRAQ